MVQTILNGSMSAGLSPMRDPGYGQTALQARKSTSKPDGNKGSPSRVICLTLKSIQLKCYMVFRGQNGIYPTASHLQAPQISEYSKDIGLDMRLDYGPDDH